MVFAIIKKLFYSKNEYGPLNNPITEAFGNVRKDMGHISKWIEHFKNKHDDHEKQFQILHNRINKFEMMLAELSNNSNQELEETFVEEEKSIPQYSQWESLTETQQKLCWLVARLQSEMPNQWISLKYLAQEIYPDKDYNKVRSTLSAYINVLEEIGYLERKRNGKQTYVYSAKRNPCATGKIKMKVKIKNEIKH